MSWEAIEYMNIKRAQVHDRSFRVNLKKLNIFFISSITLYLTIIVSQHCKYKFKCTLVMIITIHVTCGGSFCLMDLGPSLNHMDLGLSLNHTQSSGCMLRHISTSPPHPMTLTHVPHHLACVCMG